jgi:hypothetical protein
VWFVSQPPMVYCLGIQGVVCVPAPWDFSWVCFDFWNFGRRKHFGTGWVMAASVSWDCCEGVTPSVFLLLRCLHSNFARRGPRTNPKS